MNTRLINKTNNVFDLFDQAFFNEDYSFWRRPSNFTSTSSLSWGDSGDAYDLHIPLPGFKKEHIKAEIDDGVSLPSSSPGVGVAGDTGRSAPERGRSRMQWQAIPIWPEPNSGRYR